MYVFSIGLQHTFTSEKIHNQDLAPPPTMHCAVLYLMDITIFMMLKQTNSLNIFLNLEIC